tara:strand:- start:612 stop:1310 length:699 start_codon:yes stop_codon:yes gene_type:complete
MSDENVQSSNEGVTLALQAVAEVLSKMDERLAKEEEAVEIAKAQEEAEVQRTEIQEMISKAVSEALAGLNLAKEETSEEEVVLEKDEDHVKVTLEKDHVEGHDTKEDEEEEEEEEAEKGGMGYKKSQEDEIAFLKNQLDELQKGIDEKIEKEATTRLRQLGFREESGLQAPELIKYDSTIGVDEETPIKKSEDTNDGVIDQLSKLSYRELRNLQYKIQVGDTDGVPNELMRQ